MMKYLRCDICGNEPDPLHRIVMGGANLPITVQCAEHVEVHTLGSATPRYLSASRSAPKTTVFVPYDPDLAEIGVIEPVFVEEERVEMVRTGSLRESLRALPHRCSSFCPPYTKDHHVEDLVTLPTETRITTVPALRWQRVVEGKGSRLVPVEPEPGYSKILSTVADAFLVFCIIMVLGLMVLGVDLLL